MIVCPTCQHENLDGTVFCSDCGMQLEGADPTVTQAIRGSETLHIPADEKQTDFYSTGVDTWASLHLVESGHILPVSGREEFTVGRISDAQPIMPDIDLTPYKAYASGVSRLHAVLKREGERVILRDLGSSNGTYVNGKRLQANADQVLHHGDILSLGKLKIQILLRNS